MNFQVPVYNPGGRVILSLNAAKPFDSVEWPYLLEILARFGLGDHFINWVKVLYSTPRARLCINNTLSPPFFLHSSGVYTIPIVVCSGSRASGNTDRNTPGVMGFCRGPLEEKVSLYADDALIYLVDTNASLQTLMELSLNLVGFQVLPSIGPSQF